MILFAIWNLIQPYTNLLYENYRYQYQCQDIQMNMLCLFEYLTEYSTQHDIRNNLHDYCENPAIITGVWKSTHRISPRSFKIPRECRPRQCNYVLIDNSQTQQVVCGRIRRRRRCWCRCRRLRYIINDHHRRAAYMFVDRTNDETGNLGTHAAYI